MASAWVALANTTLAANTSSVTFSSISGSYRDLVVIVYAVGSANSQQINMTFNSDTGSNYSFVSAWGNGSSTSSGTISNNSFVPLAYALYFGTSTPATYIVNIMDYSATNKHKSFLSRANNPAATVEMLSGRWASTSAISSITLEASFGVGSTFALYGVSA